MWIKISVNNYSHWDWLVEYMQLNPLVAKHSVGDVHAVFTVFLGAYFEKTIIIIVVL